MAHQFQELIANRDGAIRKAKLNGRDYLVAPMVMLTEGVHQGSKGPLYYPSEELSKLPLAWDHKPVVVYHPKEKGMPVSACTPTMLEKHSVGLILNTSWDADAAKLRAEAWIEEKRVKQVDMRVYNALLNNEIMEVSTGLFSENTEVDGIWNTEEYAAIARNYRPDHLAILPDQTGACSVKDGAGLLQVNDAETWRKFTSTIGSIVENEKSWEARRRDLAKQVEETYGYSAYVEEVYDDYLIYSLSNKFYRLPFSMTGDVVSIAKQSELVERIVDYQPTANANTPPADNGDSSMSKKKIIDDLIANKHTDWKEADRTALDSMSEDTFKRIVANSKDEKTPPVDPPKPDTKTTDGDNPPADPPKPHGDVKTDEKPTGNEAKFVQIPKEKWDRIELMLNDAQRIQDAEKQRLISVITANESNVLEEDDLKKMNVETLRGMAALARGSAAADDGLNLDRYDFSLAGTPGDISNNADDGDMPPSLREAATFNAEEYNKSRKK